MTPYSPDLRCPRCRRLLAKRMPNGGAEIKARGRLIAVVEHGLLVCSDCDVQIQVRAGSVPRLIPAATAV